jgi:hypothetical protein
MAKATRRTTAAKPAASTVQRGAAPNRASVPATTRETTAVAAKRGTGELFTRDTDMSAPLPAFMNQDVGKGLEAIGRNDMEVPRLKLMQALSPELETYNDLAKGDFFHTAAEHNFGTKIIGVPIFMDRRYILWNPRDSGGGILARADDGVHWSPANAEFDVKLDKKDGGAQVKWRTAKTVQESGLGEWGSMNPGDSNSPPAATLMYNYLLAFPEMPDLMPAVLTFQRSSVKMGRRFNTKLKTIRAPIFGLVFEFSSFEDTNNAGQKFYNIQATGAGRITDQGLYNEYKKLHEGFASAGLQVKDLETLADDPVGDNQPDTDRTETGRRI